MKPFFLLLLFPFFAGAQHASRYYPCVQSENPIQVDGKITGQEWENAPWSELFVDIEGAKQPAPSLQTKFKMKWDQEHLYFLFWLEEPHLVATLTENESVIFRDNDIEIFLDPNGDNHLYMEYEINALGTYWDLLLVKPYQNGGPALTSWNFSNVKRAVGLKGTLNDASDIDEGWFVELAIPWQSMMETYSKAKYPGLNTYWRINFSRVQWNYVASENGYEKKTDKNGKPLPENNWVWAPHGVIDMHQPDLWGYVAFVEHKDIALDLPVTEKMKKQLMEMYRWVVQYKRKNKQYPVSIDNALLLSKLNENKLNYHYTTLERYFEIVLSDEKGNAMAIDASRKIYLK